MKQTAFCRIAALVITFMSLVSAEAQTNPYKINDELYVLYQEAFKHRTSSACLPLAETLYRESVRKNDKKAQCIALGVPVIYYMSLIDSVLIRKAVERQQKVSRENGYLQYYYFAGSNYIIWLLNNGYSLRALHYAQHLQNQAIADNHHYGFFTCLRAQGHIYNRRGDKENGGEYYKKALEYMLDYLPEQDPASICRNIIDYYVSFGSDSLTQAMQYAEKALAYGKTYESKMRISLQVCEILFKMKRYEDFIQLYDSCQTVMAEKGVVVRQQPIVLNTYKAILQNDFDLAKKEAGKIQNNKFSYYSLMVSISLKENDYKQAYSYTQRLNRYMDSVSRQVRETDLAELSVQLGAERMKREAQALELENTELTLKNTALTLKNTQLELEQAEARAYIEQERMNNEMEQQQAEQKERELINRNRINLLSLGLFSSFLFLCFLGVYLYRHRRLITALTRSNQALAVARDLAEQSDNIKTQFIQNMSHEIRTPLNAIVGFSQLLTTPGMELDENEKTEYGELIQQNSELLTTLINDVLDLANLESGKYTMRRSPCSCNDLCRTALASVRHRKGDAVKQIFTSEVNDGFLLTTDGKRVRQVLINFLTNAEKYTEQGEIHLHCSTSEVPGHITFSVADTGPGVPADKIDLIFNRFYKVDHFKQGTGLGLNICRIIAERLHGEVKYDRTYTRGARFVLVLPL